MSRKSTLAPEVLERRRKIQTVGCPQCGAEPGLRCKTPQGFATTSPHAARRSAAADAKAYVP